MGFCPLALLLSFVSILSGKEGGLSTFFVQLFLLAFLRHSFSKRFLSILALNLPFFISFFFLFLFFFFNLLIVLVGTVCWGTPKQPPSSVID